MSTDNLMLTEHAIKRHAKRLKKQMINYNQDLSLGESQNLLSKVLGFNDWNHLKTIIKNSEKSTDTSIKRTCVIISNSAVIRQSVKVFLESSANGDEHYSCYTFANIIEYEEYVLSNKCEIDYIISDGEFSSKVDYNLPIIMITNEKENDIIYKSLPSNKLLIKYYLLSKPFTKQMLFDVMNYSKKHD